MKRATKVAVIAVTLVLTLPALVYFAFLPAKGSGPVEPVVFFNGPTEMPVTSVAVSDDNETVVVGMARGNQGAVALYTKSGFLLGRFPSNPNAFWGPVTDVAIDSSGGTEPCGLNIVAGSRDGRVVLILRSTVSGSPFCGAITTTREFTFTDSRGQRASINAVDIDRAGKWFVAGTDAGSVGFFLVSEFVVSGRPLARYQGPIDKVNAHLRTGTAEIALNIPLRGATQVAMSSDANGEFDRVAVGTGWGEVWIFSRASVLAQTVVFGPAKIITRPLDEQVPNPAPGVSGTNVTTPLPDTRFAVTALDYTERPDSFNNRHLAVGWEAEVGLLQPSQTRAPVTLYRDPGPIDSAPLTILETTGLPVEIFTRLLAGNLVTDLAISESTIFRNAGLVAVVAGTDAGVVEFFRSDSKSGAGNQFPTNSWSGESVQGAAVTAVAITANARHIAASNNLGHVSMWHLNHTLERTTNKRPVWTTTLTAGPSELAMADDGSLSAGTGEGRLVTFAAPPTAFFRIGLGVNAAGPFTFPAQQPPPIQKGLFVALDSTSLAPDVPLVRIDWYVQYLRQGKWEGFFRGTGDTVTFQVNRTGSYRVWLDVEDATGSAVVLGPGVVQVGPGGGHGVLDETGGGFSVGGQRPQCVLEAAPLFIKPGETVTFDASNSTDPDGTIIRYTFSFGDGTQQSSESPVVTHTYQTSGVFQATLTLTDSDNLPSLQCDPVFIGVGAAPPPKVIVLPFQPVRDLDANDAGTDVVACGGTAARGGVLWAAREPDGDLVNVSLEAAIGSGTVPQVDHCVVSEDGGRIAYGMISGKVTAQQKSDLARSSHTATGDRITGLDISADGQHVFACTQGGRVMVFGPSPEVGPAKDFELAASCHGLAATGSGESFVVVAGDQRIHLFRRTTAHNGPVDTELLEGVPQNVEMQKRTVPDGRHNVIVGERDGGTELFIVIGSSLFRNGRYQDPSNSAGNATISDTANREWVAPVALAGGKTLFFRASAPRDADTNPVPVGSFSTALAANDAGVSGHVARPEGDLSGRHTATASEDSFLYKFDGMLDAPVWAFRSFGRTGMRATDLSKFGMVAAGDAGNCHFNGLSGSCLYVFEEPPTADFRFGVLEGAFLNTTRKPTIDDVVTFDAGITIVGKRPLVNWTWSFGDGAHGYGATVGHMYAEGGTYTVLLTVRDSFGTFDRVQKRVTVLGSRPIALLACSPSSAQTFQDVTFDARASRDPGGAIVEYRYSFGDSAALLRTGSPLVRHQYTNDGAYSATVTVVDGDGFTDTSPPCVVTIGNRAPTASFFFQQANFQNSTEHVDADRPVDFSGAGSSDVDGQLVEWRWTFGDGSPLLVSATPGVQHTYGAVGDYTVTLRVKDNDGALSAPVSRALRADDSIRIANITLDHDDDADGDNRHEMIFMLNHGVVLVEDSDGNPVAGAFVHVVYAYDGPGGGLNNTPDDGDEFAEDVVLTGVDGTASFTIPFNNPDGLYVPGRYHIVADARKDLTAFGDTEWDLGFRRYWAEGPAPT